MSDDLKIHPAVVVSDVYPGSGGAIPGTARLACPILEQNEIWRTKDGRLVRLEDMEPRFALGVAATSSFITMVIVIWRGQ